jgi:ketosteroid isomerase-like protein
VPADRDAVVTTYGEYFRAFQALDAERVLPYYHLPCLFLSPRGVTLVTTPTEGRALLTGMMGGLAAHGYAKSEWADLEIKPLSGDLALLSTRVRRLTARGDEMERFGATYTLRKTTDGWKIVVLAIHDPVATTSGVWKPAEELGRFSQSGPPGGRP